MIFIIVVVEHGKDPTGMAVGAGLFQDRISVSVLVNIHNDPVII